MSQSKFGEWESRGEAVDAAMFKVAGRHHIHGVQCLCGFKSHRSRSRTEHIIDATLAALVSAGVVAEEPEWETECRRLSLHGGLPVWHERRVTPWVPVKQEGEVQ